MTTYYRIADWDRHYEVDGHGHAWQPGKGFRHGPIDYVRNKARGREFSRSALAMADLAGESMYWAMGVFGKIAEIVARTPRPQRQGGIIRNRKGEPATAEEIAWMLRVKIETLQPALALLAHPEVAWIEEVPESSLLLCQESQEAAHGSGNSGSSQNSGISGDSGISGSHVAYTDKSSRSRSQVKRSQVNEPGESPDAGETRRPPDGPCDDPGLVQPYDSHDVYLEAGFDSTRLSFLRELRSTLRLLTNSDHQTVINFEQWFHDRIAQTATTPEDRNQQLMDVITLARDCQNGDSPIAVFLSRARAELGYVPPSRQTERRRLVR